MIQTFNRQTNSSLPQSRPQKLVVGPIQHRGHSSVAPTIEQKVARCTKTAEPEAISNVTKHYELAFELPLYRRNKGTSQKLASMLV